jgi:molecular chaperone DnaK
VTVGARARRFLDSDPENTRAEFKRLMGTPQQLAFAAAKLTKKPEELAAEVLKSLRADAKDQLGFAPEKVVVTVPALFELPQSAATSEAARLAGFERVELLQEPVASALAAGWTEQDSAGSWLVYDLGGGTFDASLLETRDGLLRVVGHDGDNFLGGRDFDSAIVDWVLEELTRIQQVEISRGDPQHAAAIRKLRYAAEEAKMELGRAQSAVIALPSLFHVNGDPIDVDVELDRATLERLCLPLVDRSIAVCQRLLDQHSVDARGLARIVLVGGPTVMPMLRDRVSAALGAPFGEGLDPMTLVAQGAAIYAATAGLDARPAEKAKTAGRKLWLQYPAMTSDLTPHVVGRLVQDGSSAPAPVEITLRRDDDRWTSPASPIDAEGAFFALVELVPRRPNVFLLEASDATGQRVPVDPPSLTIMQGLTITDPPLSRSIGVALASNRVQVYFERGTPLPARRRFVHHTVETVARGSNDCLLRIPVVQGEFELAHLCRLVGTLEISGAGVSASLPAGAAVEVTLELDRGGRLSAKALVPSLNQVFEQVSQLVIPDATAESLESNRKLLLERFTNVRADALRRGATKSLQRLSMLERDFQEASRDIHAAKGGDADAAQRARRTLLEIDGYLEEAEADRQWPELEARALHTYSWASVYVTEYGTQPEQRLIAEAGAGLEKARRLQNAAELQRQLRVIRNLGNTAYFRKPDAWSDEFDYATSRIDDCADLPKAEGLVREGRKAQARNDQTALRSIVQQLWSLMPAEREERRLSFESGVR